MYKILEDLPVSYQNNTVKYGVNMAYPVVNDEKNTLQNKTCAKLKKNLTFLSGHVRTQKISATSLNIGCR